MSTRLLDDFHAPWTSDPSGLWAVGNDPGQGRFTGRGTMKIIASGGPSATQPYVEREFKPALDLQNFRELRFWFRASRPADGTPAAPFYLSLEAFTDRSHAPGWQRLLSVSSKEEWDLQTLWLGDMPAALRTSVGLLRLRGLDGGMFFSASMDRLVAAAPEPVQDLDEALLARLDKTFQASVRGTMTTVPADMDVPESSTTRSEPYILITPLAIRPGDDAYSGSGRALVDNYFENGAFERPAPRDHDFDYRIDVFAQDRPQKALLMDQILAALNRDAGLVVNEVPVKLRAFTPASEPDAGRTPFHVRATLCVETGDRVALDQAIPYLLVGPLDSRDQAVLVAL